MRPNQFSINHGNVLIATNGEKIIGEPVQFNIEANSVVGDTPRMALHEDRIYFRSGEDLVSVDKRLSGKPVNVIDGSVQMYRGPPASHCIDNEGLIWAITQVHGEEAPSIKAHNSTGEILTHIYPENFPSGWPSNRSMALNSEGLLAYTDPLRDRIHFYQI